MAEDQGLTSLLMNLAAGIGAGTAAARRAAVSADDARVAAEQAKLAALEPKVARLASVGGTVISGMPPGTENARTMTQMLAGRSRRPEVTAVPTSLAERAQRLATPPVMPPQPAMQPQSPIPPQPRSRTKAAASPAAKTESLGPQQPVTKSGDWRGALREILGLRGSSKNPIAATATERPSATEKPKPAEYSDEVLGLAPPESEPEEPAWGRKFSGPKAVESPPVHSEVPASRGQNWYREARQEKEERDRKERESRTFSFRVKRTYASAKDSVLNRFRRTPAEEQPLPMPGETPEPPAGVVPRLGNVMVRVGNAIENRTGPKLARFGKAFREVGGAMGGRAPAMEAAASGAGRSGIVRGGMAVAGAAGGGEAAGAAAAGGAAAGGAAAGEVAAGAAAVATGFTAVVASTAAVVGAVVGLAAAAVGTVKGLEALASNLMEGNREFARFSPLVARTFATLDRQQLILAGRTAVGTSGTTNMLGGELGKLREEMQPLNESVGNLMNMAGTSLVEIARVVNGVIAPPMKVISEAAKSVAEWFGYQGQQAGEKQAFVAFFDALGQDAAPGPRNRRPEVD